MPRNVTKIMTGWQFYFEKKLPHSVDAASWMSLDELSEYDQEFANNLSKHTCFRDVTLPHDWAIEQSYNRNMQEGNSQGFRDRWGIGWYRKILYVENKKAGYRYYLDFGGVVENSTIWINGMVAGKHYYGYSSFRVDVTEFVKDGDNQILIKVDNTVSPADRWYSGCGIYRTVKWMEVEEKHLDPWEVVVTTELDEKYTSAVVRIRTGVKGQVLAELREAGDDSHIIYSAYSKSNGEIPLEVVNPKLWSAEEPYLYDLKLHLYDCGRKYDSISLPVGIREVVFDAKKGMLVNGKSVTLQGVCLHQDMGARGIAATKGMWRERLLKLKEMGCNSIRPTHHVFSEEFIELCDELGFYVYEECFDKWVYGSYARYFETCWQSDMDAMIKRDRNHPSIVIWGVGNEETNQGQESMLKILKRLYDYAKSLDDTRPVSCATKPIYWRDLPEGAEVKGDLASACMVYDNAERLTYIKKWGEIVDILCCNYQEQWYPMIHEVLPDKLILGTEVYPFFRGHGTYMQNYALENPALEPKKLDYCIGSMVWTGIDYLGESTGYPAKGRSNAMIKTNGERRPIYYIMQSYWTKEPMVHFSVMDYSLQDEGMKLHWSFPPYVDHWHFPQFHKTVIPYMIATNCEEVKLYVNGKEYGPPKPEQFSDKVITGFVPYLPGTIEVVGYRFGEAVCSHKTVTPGPVVRLVFDKGVQKISANEGHEMLLTVRAVDGEGNPCFRESAYTRFMVEGPAEIVAVDNGNLMDSKCYQETSVHMHHGQWMLPARYSVCHKYL